MTNEEPELDQSKIPEMMDKSEEAYIKSYYLLHMRMLFDNLTDVKAMIRKQNKFVEWTFILVFAIFFTLTMDRILNFFQ